MILDIQFTAAGILIILCLIPLYIYRKVIYAKFTRSGDLAVFLNKIKEYLSSNHPKFNYNLEILQRVKDEKDIRRREILIIEDLINQFANFEYELNTQAPIAKDKLWNGYEENSFLIKDNKLPNDWGQRKEASWLRDKGRCNRCGKQIKLEDSQPLLAKQMKNGGGFNVENIVILCSDCSKIIKSSNLERTVKDLHMTDDMIRKFIS